MFRILCGLLLTTLLSTPLLAQRGEQVKFGKVSDEDLALMTVPGDTTAEAYVLHHQQDLAFDYLPERGVVRQETVHRRIKLLKPSSFGRADVSLYYHEGNTDLNNVKAMIHLPNGDREKLSGKDIIRQNVNDDFREVKFTFPRVEPGAVIEYTYTRQATSILVPSPFTFQEDIPVRYAEFTGVIPEYFKYISLGTQGAFTVNEQETILQNFGTQTHRSSGGGDSRIRHERMRYVMEDIPAARVQPYTNNADDYLPKVKLQLRSYQYPNQAMNLVISDWYDMAQRLHEDASFGKYYTVGLASNEIWKDAEAEIMAGATERERIDRAYYFVCRNLQWNERYSYMGSDTPDRAYKSRSGNSADLNLTLLALLHRAGIQAYPMLVSLRDEGNHIEVYPIVDQFDHVMVYTEVDGNPYILDANGTARPPGLPRIHALNHRGWIARPGAPQWLPLEVPAARQIVMAQIDLDASGHATATVQSKQSSYFAFSGRLQANESEDWTKQPIAEDIIAVFPEAKVLSHDPPEEWNPGKPLTTGFTMDVPAAVSADDYVYLQPILMRLLDQGLDDVETRIYPVDFPHPWQKQFIATVKVPEGFVVDELPESVRVMSEDGGMEATYSASVQPDQSISVRLAVTLKQTVYPATAYPALRTMYTKIIEMQEAPIVLKRAKK